MGLFDSLLDASVVLSFDASGFRRHARRFDPEDLPASLAGASVLVTGANSGLGLATVSGLAALGATVHLLCRDEGRGAAALARVQAAHRQARLHLHRLDVSSLADVRRFAAAFEGPVDVLVNNAGVLPATLQRTAEGNEVTLATNLLGPHLLTRLLLPRLIAARGRVVTVSSGGMLLQRLDLRVLQAQVARFDGVVAYAQTKRAEVILSALWAARAPEVTFSAMHPGWADTPAVRTSLPTFHAWMRGRLRTAEEGADTVVWLAAAPRLAGQSGRFWFDRQEASPHPLAWTQEAPGDAERLWTLVEGLTAG